MSMTRSTSAGLTAAHSASRPVRWALGVLVFATATAIGAKVSVFLPGTPIPFTFQPLVVLLAGALLGARLGAASQVAYLAAGMAGLPVFAAGGGAAYLLGPTGGYLMAYPVAAFVVGGLVRAGWTSTVAGLLAGLAVIYAGGLAWLAAVGSFDTAVVLGLQPFVLADLVKVALAAVVTMRLRERSLDVFSR
jgi:biotin transport system substrate-specific component